MAATVKQALCGLSPQYNLFNLRVRNDAAVEVGRDDASYPMSVKHKGKEFWKTGKIGKRIKDGKEAAEYESSDDWRVWRTSDGEVYED